MKILETTPNHLILEDRPRLVAGFVWFTGVSCIWAALAGQMDGLGQASLVAALGVGTLWIAHQFFPFQRLRFDRRSETLTRIVARLNGRKVTTNTLSSIERAAVEAQWNEGTRMERLALVINGEQHPLEFGFYGKSRGGLANEINTWLADA